MHITIKLSSPFYFRHTYPFTPYSPCHPLLFISGSKHHHVVLLSKVPNILNHIIPKIIPPYSFFLLPDHTDSRAPIFSYQGKPSPTSTIHPLGDLTSHSITMHNTSRDLPICTPDFLPPNKTKITLNLPLQICLAQSQHIKILIY